MALTRRLVKGQALTAAEHDANIDHFEQNPNGIYVPKSAQIGIKIDETSPDWGWHDLTGQMAFEEATGTTPTLTIYQGTIKQRLFDVNDIGSGVFHMPHDYAEGTDLYLHTHWSHTSATVTTGAVNWQAEVMYAKGHDQASFSTPIIVNMNQNASTTRYQHMIAESPMSAAAGAGGLLVTGDMEADGLIIIELSLTSNTMDGGAMPYFHTLDIHYQSTGVATKQRAPAFHV